MRYTAIVLVWVLMIVGADRAHTQEHCNALLSHGISNEWSSISQKEWDNLIFHRHCQKKESSWAFSHDGQVGLKVPIPIGIAGSWFGSQEKRDAFCRGQAESSEGRETEAARLSLLSVEGLNAWNQCQLLTKRNVEITVGDLEGQLLSFTIRRTGGASVALKTVAFEGVASCSVDGKAVNSGDPLNEPVDVGQVVIRCRRAEAELRDGIQVAYRRAEIGIDTSEGSLDVNLRPVEKVYPETVEELRRENDLKIRAFEKNLSERPSDRASTILSHGGHWGDWRAVRMCPAGQYVCGYRSRFESRQGDGDDTALNAVELYCCRFVGEAQ